jgi:exosome complex component RRP43
MSEFKKNYFLIKTFLTKINCRESILTDPTEEEEALSSGSITIVSSGDELCCVHKPGGCRLTEVQLEDCVTRTQKRSQLLRGMVEASIKSIGSL